MVGVDSLHDDLRLGGKDKGVQKHEEISKVEKDSVLRHTEYGRVNIGRRQVPRPFQVSKPEVHG